MNSPSEPTFLDLETAAVEGVEQYYDDSEPIEAPSNYVKPEAIENYIARERVRRKQAFIEKAALDPDLCCIAYLGFSMPDSPHLALIPCRSEQEECDALTEFWCGYQPGEVLCGFNIRAFDLPVLYRRSLYLGVEPKPIDRDRYRSTCVLDLFEMLNEGRKHQMHSLDWYCNRFGIPCDIVDTITGADVPDCVANGEWDKVQAHLLADLCKVRGLAQRIGIARREVAA